MVKYKKDLRIARTENVRGGNGEVEMMHLFENDELLGHTQLFSLTTLDPGDSVGYHQHTDNSEVYVMLEGEAVVTEDGKTYVLNTGDVEYCPCGHHHGIENKSDQIARFVAVIFPK